MPDSRGRCQTGVSIVLRDAIPMLAPVQHEYDAAAVRRTLPLHITLLFPFVPRDDLGEAEMQRLRDFFAARRPLTIELADIGEFPSVVYAKPRPEHELRALMRALWRDFPEMPPYEGEFEDPAPHMTLGRVPDGVAQEDFVARLRRRVAPLLPLRCHVRDVSVLEEHEPDRWRELLAFPLGSRGPG